MACLSALAVLAAAFGTPALDSGSVGSGSRANILMVLVRNTHSPTDVHINLHPAPCPTRTSNVNPGQLDPFRLTSLPMAHARRTTRTLC